MSRCRPCRIVATVSTDSVAGLTPITASPQPYSRPSTAASRMPPRSSAGWFGCTRTRQDAAFAQGVAAARHVANLAGGDDQILIAHQLGDRGDDFRRDAPRQRPQLLFAGRVVEQPFAELADGQRTQRIEGVAVERVEKEAAYVVFVGIDQRTIDDMAERHVGENELGGDAFAFGACGDAGQLVAGLLLIGPGEHFAQVREVKSFAANRRLIRHRRAPKEVLEDILTRAETFAPVQKSVLRYYSALGKVRAIGEDTCAVFPHCRSRR